MPFMNVIPPGLDFSNLKVNLPADPAVQEMQHMKHAFNANTVPVDGTSPTMRQEGADLTSLHSIAYQASKCDEASCVTSADGKKTSFSKGRPRGQHYV